RPLPAVAAGCRSAIGTSASLPTASRLIPSASCHCCSVCARTRPGSPRWNGSCFVGRQEDPAMMSALASKIVVVTGATGQVGWGIAHAALDTGATVVLPVRSEAARKKVEREFGKARTSIVTVDFADESSLATMRDATLERFGPMDHV